MITDPATISDRARPTLALFVMVAGTGGLAAGMAIFAGDLPGTTPDTGSLILSMVALCMVMLLWGAAPAWSAGQLLRRPWLGVALPAWSVAVGTISWWLAQAALSLLAVPGATSETNPARDVTVCSVLILVLTLGSAVVTAAFTVSWRAAARCSIPILLLGAPWIGLGLLAYISASEAGAGRLGRPVSWTDILQPLLAVLAAGVGGAAIGHSLRRPTARRVLAAVLAVCVAAAAGWLLVRSPASEAGGHGQPMSMLLVFLGMDVGGLQWFLGFLVATLVLGWAQWSGLLLSKYETEAGGVRPFADGRSPAARGPRKWIAGPGRAYALLTLAYGLFVVYGSLVPLEFNGWSFDQAYETFLKTPYLAIDINHRSDMVANLLLFIPLTFFAMGAWTRENSRHGRGWKAACIVAMACLLSVAVEFSQAFFPPRTVSLNDIQNECIGGALGAGLWLLSGSRVTRWFRDIWRLRDPRRLAIHICMGYVVFLAMYELFPFDFVVSADELAEQLSPERLNLVPLGDLRHMSLLSAGAKIAMLLPVGYLVALLRRGRSRPVLAAALLGGAYALILEVLRIPVYSRGANATDLLLGIAGAAFGGWLATRFGPAATRPLPQSKAWGLLSFVARLAAGLGGATAIFWYKWQPWHFHWPQEGLVACVRDSLRIPFYYQYYNTEFQATLQLGADTLAPLMLALVFTSLFKPLGRAGRWMAGASAACVAVAAEAGQLLFPPRVPDLTTTVFFAVFGAVLGVWLYGPLVRIFVAPPAAPDGPRGDWLST
jgi:VanZ family protein